MKAQIYSGQWKKDDHLVEAEIADRMGMSRSPVRAALSTLAQEGDVETIPYRGYFVTGKRSDFNWTAFSLIYFLTVWSLLADYLEKTPNYTFSQEADQVIKKLRQALGEKNWQETTRTEKDLLGILFIQQQYPLLVEELGRAFENAKQNSNDYIKEECPDRQAEFEEYLVNSFEDTAVLFRYGNFAESKTIAKLMVNCFLNYVPDSARTTVRTITPYDKIRASSTNNI